MNKKSLKLLSCIIINEAKISTERKIKLVEAVREANEKELISFIRENKQILQEIRPKTKSYFSIAGAMGSRQFIEKLEVK